tara:strand:- start:628 stop:1164 length:537 start_codon:yes stop_codon:yes gene_type:complete
MNEVLAAIGAGLVEHAVWIGVGVIAVAVYLGRRNDSGEAQVRAAVHWMEHALEEAPDRLYHTVHPNWSVYRKQLTHRLKVAVPALPETSLHLVLAEFDACYQLSDGVFIRIGSAVDESAPPADDFIPLVAPMEGFRLRKVQARQRWRRVRAVTIGVVLYFAVVVLGLWGLVLFRVGLP